MKKIIIETADEKIVDALCQFAQKYGLQVTVTDDEQADAALEALLEQEEWEPTGKIVPIKEVPRFRRDDTQQHVYFFRRGGRTGYVGLTSLPVEKRIDQHLSKARDPFTAWLLHGLDEGDLECGIIEDVIGRKAGEAVEREWIKKLRPEFNRANQPLPLSIRLMGGLTTFAQKEEEL